MRLIRMVGVVVASVVFFGTECQAQGADDGADNSHVGLGGCAAELLARMEMEYDELDKKIEAGRRSPFQPLSDLKYEAFESVFDKHVGDDRQLRQQLVEEILKRADTGFAGLCLREMIRRFARSGDRTSLIHLLSNRCPERTSLHDTVESNLIISYSKSLADGTIVLCDAFDKAEVEEAKKGLAGALRRGYGFVIVAEDDAEFVAQVRRWYQANRDKYVPNDHYFLPRHNGSQPEEGVLISTAVAEQRARQPKEPPRPAKD